jgi:UPF0716 protein FxsA
MPLLPLAILAWPLVEIAGFIVVGSQIGVLATIGLIVATAIVGAILLRVQGFGAMTRIRQAAARDQSPAREIIHGAMIMLAGILLLIPGFLTDLLGILLFLPPVRELAWRLLKDRIVEMPLGEGGFAAGFRSGRGGRARVIDLDASDYSTDDGPDEPPRPTIDHRP